MARSGMKPVYVGDVGEIVPQTPKMGLPEGLDLEKISYKKLCNLAIACGIPFSKIIGQLTHCYEHTKLIAIGGRELPAGMNFWDHTYYCNNCFLIFRIKELPKDD